MRNPIILLAVLLAPAGAAYAQVTVDLHALDSLPLGSGVLPAPAPYLPGPGHARRSVPELRRVPAAGTEAKTGTEAVTSAVANAAPPRTARAPAASAPTPAQLQPAQPQPALPTEAPATVALAPITPSAPAAQAARPPPPPVSATALTEAKAADGGLRVTFGSTDADLNPASVASVKQYAGGGPSGDTTYNVLAYAAGSPSDPSAARRLSLSRALAVRSALMADGVASSRIFVRALGSSAGNNGPADRVDVSRLGANAAAVKSQ
jgi:outer membrane protein OmpA-like peptidoglycan-associated protein